MIENEQRLTDPQPTFLFYNKVDVGMWNGTDWLHLETLASPSEKTSLPVNACCSLWLSWWMKCWVIEVWYLLHSMYCSGQPTLLKYNRLQRVVKRQSSHILYIWCESYTRRTGYFNYISFFVHENLGLEKVCHFIWPLLWETWLPNLYIMNV